MLISGEAIALGTESPDVYCLPDPVGYVEAYNLQMRLLEQRYRGEIPDTLVLLEHSPVITLGKSGQIENILLPGEELEKMGVSLYFTDRGGDVTYHGPGQLVAYPIIDLRKRGRDIQNYISGLEEVVIRTLADFSISAGRDSENVGVWVGEDKIAAIGVRVRKWITMHGLALNVNPDLRPFSFINPCGLPGKGVTSMQKELSREVPIEVVRNHLISHFAEVFDSAAEECRSTRV